MTVKTNPHLIADSPDYADTLNIEVTMNSDGTPSFHKKPPLSLFKVERENADLSQAKLAKELSVSKSAIIRTEQGLFVLPNESYVEWMQRTRGYTAKKLYDVYRSFQERTRKYHGKGGVASYIHNSCFSILNTGFVISHKHHPLIYLCMVTSGEPRSVASFIKAFCLPYSEVQRWATYPANVKTVPSSVISALKDAGYSKLEIHALIDYYDHYRRGKGYK